MSATTTGRTPTTRKKRRLYAVLAGLTMLGIAAALVLFAFEDNIVFFYSPSKIAKNNLRPGQTVRLGGLVETGSVDAVLDHPLHPYTRGLIGSVPSRNTRGQPLNQIPGMTPSLLNLPKGCAFRTRCSFADELCEEGPEITSPIADRGVRCFHPHMDRTK